MFQRILVPLDGSRRAESAIPVAATIARATGGSLCFLRVVTLPGDTALFVQEPLLFPESSGGDELRHAEEYLKLQAQKIRDLSVQTRIVTGLAAPKILSCLEEMQMDLIVLCSRGETGLNQWLWGSVAHKIVRQSPVPVLVLHESAGLLSNSHPMGLRPVRILVALDGSKQAEEALMPAALLASALSTPLQGILHLVRILPEAAHAQGPGSSHQLPGVIEAQAYLRTTEQAFRAEICGKLDLRLISSVVVQQPIAETLIGIAEDGLPDLDSSASRSACDVLALTIHGRAGLLRWFVGSVADQLLDGSRLPLLVLHPMLPAQAHHVPFSQEEAMDQAVSFKEAAKKDEKGVRAVSASLCSMRWISPSRKSYSCCGQASACYPLPAKP